MAGEKQKCPSCGENLVLSKFYLSNSPLYKGNKGIMIFCKECLVGMYEKYFKTTNDPKSATKMTCLKFDMPFDESSFEGALGQVEKSEAKLHIFRTYVTKINSLGAFNDVGLEFEAMNLMGINIEDKKENLTVEQKMAEIEKAVKLTDEDIQTKKDVIKLIGYDLFVGYSEFDQKFLYNEILPYLDEDMMDDSFKLSQVVQLINNNNQIRKIDLVINLMSSNVKDFVENQGSIKSYTSTKNQIVQSTDKIAKENSISVKNRGDKSAGKSTLTYMMKNYRELGFEDAEQDYYDQKKAHGMKMVADISNRSILDQLQLDENDMNDIFFNQKQMLQELQTKVLDLEEENRQLHEKISTFHSVEA